MKKVEHELQAVCSRLIAQKLIKNVATVENNEHFTTFFQSFCCFAFMYTNKHFCGKYSCAFSEFVGLVHSKSVTIVCEVGMITFFCGGYQL